jgi:hypothetical protein
MHTTMEELLEAVFSLRSEHRLYKEEQLQLRGLISEYPPVEAGYNTSIIALRS